MPRIRLKDVPEHLHAQQLREADANHRSLNGEAIRRIELSFELESALNSLRDAAWLKEAMASGPEEPLTRAKFDAAVRQGLQQANPKAA
jgi:hypothetical protein